MKQILILTMILASSLAGAEQFSSNTIDYAKLAWHGFKATGKAKVEKCLANHLTPNLSVDECMDLVVRHTDLHSKTQDIVLVQVLSPTAETAMHRCHLANYPGAFCFAVANGVQQIENANSGGVDPIPPRLDNSPIVFGAESLGSGSSN